MIDVTTAFSGSAIDRVGERRADPAWVASCRADPARRAIVVTKAGVAVEGAGDYVSGEASWDAAVGGTGGARLARADVPTPDDAVLLGVEDGAPLFAVAAPEVPAGTQAVPLRDAASLVPHADAGLASYATAILNWHRTHRFCANCGHATDVDHAGFIRACPNCGRQHHPRTDPVVIMLVTRGDELLLGRQAAWPPDRYSALAGFVEPGESLEEAVAREVDEEAGIAVTDIRYVASQPWPFPANLMLGFIATHAGGEAAVHDAELEDVRWFSRDEVAAAARDEGALRLPPPLAIARNLIDVWLQTR